MPLLQSLLSVGLVALCLTPFVHLASSEGRVGTLEKLGLERVLKLNHDLEKRETNIAVEEEISSKNVEDGKKIKEFKDFEDDDDDDDEEPIDVSNLKVPNIESITHLHKIHGEILVPCFGMWWPVGGGTTGGGAVYYDYGVEYYDDEGKRRRRSRKRKKAAKMKKRKKN